MRDVHLDQFIFCSYWVAIFRF